MNPLPSLHLSGPNPRRFGRLSAIGRSHTATFELSRPEKRIGSSLTTGDGTLALSAWAGLGLHVEVDLPRHHGQRRHTGMSASWMDEDGSLPALFLRAEVLHDENADDDKRRGWSKYGDALDWFLGPAQIERRDLGTIETWLEMPEGRYRCRLALSYARWMRDRLVRTGWRGMYDIEFLDGYVPEPTRKHGADDGVHRRCEVIDGPIEPDLVLSHIARAIFQTRHAFGGADWTPPNGWPTWCRPYPP